MTSFIAKDKDIGSDRSHRPDILFQVKANGSQHYQEPTGYMVDEGRVVLDRWMHGVRSFQDVLPSTLTSEVDGQSIEYYMRQNAVITLYDIIGK